MPGQVLSRPARGGQDLTCASPLASRVAKGASVNEVAAAVVSVWSDAASGLSPIIGARGVVALFNRCVYLTAQVHPWLASAGRDAAAELDLPALEALFLVQTAAAALVAGNDMFEGFHQLLGSLIGASLAERLLRSAWGPPSSKPPTQDTSS